MSPEKRRFAKQSLVKEMSLMLEQADLHERVDALREVAMMGTEGIELAEEPQPR